MGGGTVVLLSPTSPSPSLSSCLSPALGGQSSRYSSSAVAVLAPPSAIVLPHVCPPERQE